MSKKCGHTVPCGCKDVPLTTGAPCGDGIDCTGNPCAENFCAECILWCGPGLPNLGITTGMPLSDAFQLLEISAMGNIACIDGSDGCKSVLLDTPIVTADTIELTWTALDPTLTQTFVLIYEDLATGVGGKVTVTAGATTVKLEGLTAETTYSLQILAECDGIAGDCGSALITVKTLKTT